MAAGIKEHDVCMIAGCARKHHSRGFCQNHYKQEIKKGTFDDEARNTSLICSIQDCDDRRHIGEYCSKHYWKKRTYGEPTPSFKLEKAPKLYPAKRPHSVKRSPFLIDLRESRAEDLSSIINAGGRYEFDN